MPLPFWGSTLRRGHGYDGPLYAPNSHDVLVLGNEKLPGTARVDALPEHVYDRQKAQGRDGATLVLRGYLPGPIDIEWTLWTEEQWEKAQEIIPKIWRKPGKLAPPSEGEKKSKAALSEAEAAKVEERALDIRHPGLLWLNVERVVIKGISPPKPGSVPQSRVVHIKCIEFVPPPKVDQQPTVVKGSKSQLKAPSAGFVPNNGQLDPPRPGPLRKAPTKKAPI